MRDRFKLKTKSEKLKVFMMNKKNKGFTLLELLVVIVIIGLVATITITMVYMSKNRAKKARIVADLSQIRKAAELFYNGNNYSYRGLRGASDILTLKTDISEHGGQLNVLVGVDSYVAYSVYPGALSGHYWCVDSKGASKDVSYTPSGGNCDDNTPASSKLPKRPMPK